MLNWIYESLVSRLTAPAAGLGLNHVDWYRGQERDPDTSHAYNKPAVLIEFMPSQPRTISGDGIQMYVLSIRLHIIEESYQDTQADSPQRVAATLHLERLSAINKLLWNKRSYKVVGGVNTCIHNGLYRTGERPGHTGTTNIISTVQEWRCLVLDYSAVNKPVHAPTDRDATGQIITQL